MNVFGVYRVTKVFAPLINESRGRIVNISSISVIVVPNEHEAGWTIREVAEYPGTDRRPLLRAGPRDSDLQDVATGAPGAAPDSPVP